MLLGSYRAVLGFYRGMIWELYRVLLRFYRVVLGFYRGII